MCGLFSGDDDERRGRFKRQNAQFTNALAIEIVGLTIISISPIAVTLVDLLEEVKSKMQVLTDTHRKKVVAHAEMAPEELVNKTFVSHKVPT